MDLVITPFSVNANNQRIPKSEASNILRTCLNQPIKIDLEGNTIGGHKNSYPVGTITFAEETEAAIIGRGVIWNEEYAEVADLLKRRTAENNPPGTSWEILFEYSTIAEDGIEDLHNTVYAANTIVSNPSYGNQTLIRAIAEDLSRKEGAIMEEERNEILQLQNMVSNLYCVLDDLWFKTFEIEEAEAVKTENVEGFSARLNDLVTRLTDRANQAGVAVAEKQTLLDDLQSKLTAIQAELDTLKAEKAQAELNAKVARRETALAEVDITLDETNKDTILEMTDTQFDLFVSGIKQVQSKYSGSKTTAEIKFNLPDPVIPQDINRSDVIESHKALYKRER